MITSVVADFLGHLVVERGASPNTVSGYRRDLNRYAEFLNRRGIPDVTAITEADITAFGVWLRTGDDDHPPLAAASVARAIVAVRSLHRFAIEDGVSLVNPAAAVPPARIGRRLPKALSMADVLALLQAPDGTQPLGLRDAALLELLYGTGARVSEVLALDVDDATALLADDQAGLRLFGKGNKERIVPVGGYARAALQAWLVRGRPGLTPRCPALFLNSRGDRLSRQSAWAVLRDNAARAGIPTEISPHTLRHSCATHLLDGGADVRVVQELLGHASVTTTQIYTMVTAEHLREVFLSAHPRAH